MLCRIADLIVEIPAAGGMDTRCREYLIESNAIPDIIIKEEQYNASKYEGALDKNTIAYIESTRLFCYQLLKYNGIYLHASAIELNGQAFLFSGRSGIGKSTHSRLWKQLHGNKAHIINDDKPILRWIDGIWYVYGTPWCGKDGINENRKAPLAGICMLKQAEENSIVRLTKLEAMRTIMPCTLHKWRKKEDMERLLDLIEKLLEEIPIYKFENKPEVSAAVLSYETMLQATKKAGL